MRKVLFLREILINTYFYVMKLTCLAAVAVCCAVVASCSGGKNDAASTGMAEPFDYTFTVTNLGCADSTVAYLYDYDALAGVRGFSPEALIDSAVVSGSAVVFNVKGSTAPVVVLNADERYILFPEAGENTFDCETHVGSGELIQKYWAYNDSIRAVYMSANENIPNGDAPEYEAFVDSVETLLQSIVDKTLDENIDNGFGYYLIASNLADMESEELDSLIARSPRLADTKRIQLAKEDFKKLEATSAGQPYTDFTIEGESGAVSLSDYVKPGQYTLVDFWASWCGPCKRAIASLKENYEELHAKGLNVVGVAVWEDAADTKVWLAANPLPWDIILDAQSIPTDIYSVKGIPTLVLIGPDGKIIARSYSDEEVIEAFNAALGE